MQKEELKNSKQQKAKNNQILLRMITEQTVEVIAEMDKLKKRLKEKNVNDKEIEKIIYDLHYENQTIYNQYKVKPEKIKYFNRENAELKERINKMSPLN